MISASRDLLENVFGALGSDEVLTSILGGEKIFDRVPERVQPPYLVMGLSSETDFGSSSEESSIILFSLHVWGQSGGRKQLQEIHHLIRNRLTEEHVTLAEHHLVHLHCQIDEINRERRSGYLHGVLKFRGVTEPIPIQHN